MEFCGFLGGRQRPHNFRFEFIREMLRPHFRSAPNSATAYVRPSLKEKKTLGGTFFILEMHANYLK